MARQLVQALRDFTYDEELGRVRTGQVFTLGGHINDAGLLKHRHVAPFMGKLTDTCEDDKGRRFAEEWQRARAGDAEAIPPAEALAERRAGIAKRVMTVGQ